MCFLLLMQKYAKSNLKIVKVVGKWSADRVKKGMKVVGKWSRPETHVNPCDAD